MQYNFHYSSFKKQNSSLVFKTEQNISLVLKTEQFSFFWTQQLYDLGSWF